MDIGVEPIADIKVEPIVDIKVETIVDIEVEPIVDIKFEPKVDIRYLLVSSTYPLHGFILYVAETFRLQLSLCLTKQGYQIN